MDAAEKLMKPFKDEAGNMRGDLDYRWVTVSVMAAYLGINRITMWRRWVGGRYPADGGMRIGTKTLYKPRIILGIDQPVSARASDP